MIPRKSLTSILLRRGSAARQNGGRKQPCSSFALHRPQQRGSIAPCTGVRFATSTPEATAEKVALTFIEPDGTERHVESLVGKNLLEAAHDNNIDLEGACGGELACSTCHLVFEKHIYDQLEPKLDDEDDMLDMALALTDTSRLGCQIKLKKEYEGMKLQIPDDGFN